MFTEHEIYRSDKCLPIEENMVKHDYCMVCTALILQKAREGLSQLSVELERPDQAFGGASG